MSQYKGAGILVLKQILKERGPAVEEAFLAKLAPELRQTFTTTLAFHWLPIDQAGQMFQAAASVLGPIPDGSLVEIGRQQALKHLSGIYRSLLSISTVNFAVQQSSRVWKNYFDRGKITSQHFPEKKEIEFRVLDFQDLPRPNRLVVSGYLTGVLELTGAKNVSVRHLENSSPEWQWTITWR